MDPYRRRLTLRLAGLIPLVAACGRDITFEWETSINTDTVAEPIPLPEPDRAGGPTLTDVLRQRRSVRTYADRALSDAELGQLLWAAQGITHERGFRTAPSAGATYPLELYVARADGLYQYRPQSHSLARVGRRDLRRSLAAAGLDQECLREAAVIVIICAVPARTEPRYGERAHRYVQLEAGHACQNLLLQAVALGLGAVPVGAFYDQRVGDLLSLPQGEQPLYLVPVGALA